MILRSKSCVFLGLLLVTGGFLAASRCAGADGAIVDDPQQMTLRDDAEKTPTPAPTVAAETETILSASATNIVTVTNYQYDIVNKVVTHTNLLNILVTNKVNVTKYSFLTNVVSLTNLYNLTNFYDATNEVDITNEVTITNYTVAVLTNFFRATNWVEIPRVVSVTNTQYDIVNRVVTRTNVFTLVVTNVVNQTNYFNETNVVTVTNRPSAAQIPPAIVVPENSYSETPRPLPPAVNTQAPFSLGYNLGMSYLRGAGVAKDPAEAAKWFRFAAEQGHAKSQFALGFMCANGLGLPGSSVEGYKWYALSLAGGYKPAAKAKGDLEKMMTHMQVAEALQRAQAFVPSVR